jgi:hypothetical protein
VGACRALSWRVAPGPVRLDGDTIGKETPYRYGVKGLCGTSIALDEFLFELPRDREARA